MTTLHPPGPLPVISHAVRADRQHCRLWTRPTPRPIHWIVRHSTQTGGLHTVSLAWLSTDPASINPATGAGPSAHTLVGRDGVLHELVAPADVAYHVGYALPGFLNVNALGMEIENSSSVALGREEPYPAVQLNAAAYREATWRFSYGLPASQVVNHRAIAVYPPGHPRAGRLGRRTDPDLLDGGAFDVRVARWLAFFTALPPDEHAAWIL